MECLLENIVAMAFLVLRMQAFMTETVDIPPCPLISGQSQKLTIISLSIILTSPVDSLYDCCIFLLETPIHRNKHSYWAFPTVMLVLQSGHVVCTLPAC